MTESTNRELEEKKLFVIQLMKQACVSAYEAGIAGNTQASLHLDQDFVKLELDKLIDSYVSEQVREARIEELQKALDTHLWNDGMGIYLKEGIAQLQSPNPQEDLQ